MGISPQIVAKIIDDIGFTALQNEAGNSIPTGKGVAVSLVEAFTNTDQYLPDTSIKAYNDKSSTQGFSSQFSGHSTGSANNFYGRSSTSLGISDIDVYAAIHWLRNGYLNSGTITPQISSTRVSSHSYVGTGGSDAASLDILKRIDFLTDKDDHILSVAMNNGSNNRPLNASAYNVIAVGRTDGNHSIGSVNINSGGGLYESTVRNRPDIVVPESSTSAATPRVASATALLAGYAHDQGSNKSKGFLTNRHTDTIYHAETSEVVKASLMAGANRSTLNTDGRADILDYRGTGNATSNGLDRRYGAGQLNILNSFHILAAGEQDAGNVSGTGFDYEESFAGLNGSEATASYLFNNSFDGALFAASLVWNLAFETSSKNESENFSDYSPVFFDLDLFLYSLDPGKDTLIASSESVIDNTENIWHQLSIGSFRLDVKANGSVEHDYGLAWQTSAVPIPGAVWLFCSAIAGLYLIRRRDESEVKGQKI